MTVLGYIGGSVLEALASCKVYELNLLVRDDKRAEPIKLHYPKAKFVYGTPNDAKVIEKAAAEADAVIRTSNPCSAPDPG